MPYNIGETKILNEYLGINTKFLKKSERKKLFDKHRYKERELLWKNKIEDLDNLNFLDIEKKLTLNINNNVNVQQLDFELNNYGKYFLKNKEEFFKLEAFFLKTFLNKKDYSLEYFFVENLLDLNYKLLIKNNIKICHLKYTAQLLANWVLLSLTINLIDRSYFETSKKIWFNRYDCIDKFVFYFISYTNFFKTTKDISKNKKSLNHLASTIFTLLVQNEIFTSMVKKFKIKKTIKKKREKLLKSFIFYNLKSISLLNNEIDFKVYLNQPKQIQIHKATYLIGEHHSTLCKIFKTNKKSNKHFELQNKDLINNFTSLEYSIDFELYDIIYKLLCKDLNITTNKKLKEWILENLKDYYDNNLYEINEDDNLEFQQTYSKYILYYIFSEIKNKLKTLKKFHLAINFDFRGRLYPKSCISPTGSKIFRYLYFYGVYSESELKTLKLFDIDDPIKIVLKECLLLKQFKNINIENNLHINYLYWIVFEIGKIFKDNLSKAKNGEVAEIDFITHGCFMIYNIENKIIELDLEEQIQYQSLLLALKNLNKGVYKKVIIFKDATASGIQLLSILLGLKNDQALKHCNLNSQTHWYDTYSYIIKLFIDEYKKKSNNFLYLSDINQYLNRKLLKHSIMTYIYGAGKKKTFNYYLKELPSELNNNYAEEIFLEFYNFLTNLFESNDFFNYSLNDLRSYIIQQNSNYKDIHIKTGDFSKVPLIYYILINYTLDRIVENKRTTVVFSKLSNLIDNDKTQRALIANVTHSLDAYYARLILEKLGYPIITIHDSFGIDILNAPLLIKVANLSITKLTIIVTDYFKKPLLIENYYSKFILI